MSTIKHSANQFAAHSGKDTDAEMQTVISLTKHWLEAVVIGLNLCPFAKAPAAKNQIRYFVSEARTATELTGDLAQELAFLSASPDVETTLLILPFVLNDFDDYNQYLDEADDVLEQLELSGELQIASFHPQYRFAGTAVDTAENNTNRSPYPVLHLLRESSIDQALKSGQDADAIVQRNIATLTTLGNQGYAALIRGQADI